MLTEIRMAAESNGMEVAATINISVHCSNNNDRLTAFDPGQPG